MDQDAIGLVLYKCKTKKPRLSRELTLRYKKQQVNTDRQMGECKKTGMEGGVVLTLPELFNS